MSNSYIQIKDKVSIGIFKCHKDAIIPEYKYQYDAGMDVSSIEDIIIEPGKFAIVSTGLKFSIPNNYEIQIRSRSGLAAKHGIAVLNSPGTIDAGYEGEIKIILINHSNTPFKVTPGMRVAQIVAAPVTHIQWDILPSINTHSNDSHIRSDKGFGSSGLM